MKWLTLKSINGEKSIKQHAFIAKTKNNYYTGEYSGNISLCGKVVASEDGEEISYNKIVSETINKNNACKRCLKYKSI
jgi:hypothetical protein